METSKVEPRSFLIEHTDCGSAYTVNTSRFFEKFEKGYVVRCPNCMKPINETLLETLDSFFSFYEQLIEQCKKHNFTIREISEEKQED